MKRSVISRDDKQRDDGRKKKERNDER